MIKQTSPSVVSTSTDEWRRQQQTVAVGCLFQRKKAGGQGFCTCILFPGESSRAAIHVPYYSLIVVVPTIDKKNTTKQRDSAYRRISDLQVKKLYLNHKSPCDGDIDCSHKTVMFQLFIKNPCIRVKYLLDRNQSFTPTCSEHTRTNNSARNNSSNQFEISLGHWSFIYLEIYHFVSLSGFYYSNSAYILIT